MEKKPKKIGVYICHCGGNISDYVDVEKVRQSVEGEDIVFIAKTTMFACSDANQRDMVEDINEGKLQEAEHDMVILSTGVLPNPGIDKFFENETLAMDEFNFVGQSDLLASPAKTSINGVFVAGTATGPMDIPDSILSAGSASSEAISYLIKHP